MPLRDLFYIASEYQKLVDKKSLYSSKLQKIPAPKFLVFYNGTEEMEDSRTEYLSAAFENLTGEPDLELKVLTLNINIGHNQELLEQCRALKEWLVDKYLTALYNKRNDKEQQESYSANGCRCRTGKCAAVESAGGCVL